MEEMQRAMYVKRAQASMPSPSPTLSPNLHIFTSLEALQTQSFWVFMEASLHRHNWLKHWPLAIDSTSISSPLYRDLGVGLKVPNHIVSSPGDHPPMLRWYSKVTLLHQQSYLYGFYYLENSKDFRSSVLETGTKTKHIFLITNHNITPLLWPQLTSVTS